MHGHINLQLLSRYNAIEPFRVECASASRHRIDRLSETAAGTVRWGLVALDLSHDEIRILLAFGDSPDKRCDEVNTRLDEHIGHVARRIDESRALQRELKELRGQCRAVQAARECGIMRSFGRKAVAIVATKGTHRQPHRTHR